MKRIILTILGSVMGSYFASLFVGFVFQILDKQTGPNFGAAPFMLSVLPIAPLCGIIGGYFCGTLLAEKVGKDVETPIRKTTIFLLATFVTVATLSLLAAIYVKPLIE